MFGYLDASSGIAGDMFLGALVGAGLDPELLRAGLAALPVGGYALRFSRVTRAGIAGWKVDVDVEAGQPSRDWAAIRSLLETASGLDPGVRDRALRIFARLAEAEAAVHGVEVERVHFHEVGAVDSIVDIVGAAIGLEALRVDEVWCSPVRVGHGTVATSHGELPIPAPATARLLTGIPVFAGEVAGELTTPTGAAIVAAEAARFAPLPPMRIAADGWGAGSRDLPIPNLTRLIVGERPSGGMLEEVVMLETTIDHASPELVAAAIDLLLAEGALDAWAEPVTMKKRRTGAALTAMVLPGDAGRLSDAIVRHTGTLGVRRTPTWRDVVPRAHQTVATSLGVVRVKVHGSGAERIVRPESDDIASIARSTGLGLAEVARRLTAEAEAAIGRLDPAGRER